MSPLARYQRWRRYRRALAVMMDKAADGGYRVSPSVYEELQKVARKAAGRPGGHYEEVAAMLMRRGRRRP